MAQTILYDLPSTQGTAWSLNPWKTRLVLNYKRIAYKTEWIEFPDVESTIKGFGLPPNPKDAPGYFTDYSIPAIRYADGTYGMDSWPIAHELEKRYPTPSLQLDNAINVQVRDLIAPILGPVFLTFMPNVPTLLPERSSEYFYRTREAYLGKTLAEVKAEALAGAEEGWSKAQEALGEAAGLLKKHGGPFFLGEAVSYADFVLVAALYFVQRLSEESFQRIVCFDAVFLRLYEACGEWLERAD